MVPQTPSFDPPAARAVLEETETFRRQGLAEGSELLL